MIFVEVVGVLGFAIWASLLPAEVFLAAFVATTLLPIGLPLPIQIPGLGGHSLDVSLLLLIALSCKAGIRIFYSHNARVPGIIGALGLAGLTGLSFWLSSNAPLENLPLLVQREAGIAAFLAVAFSLRRDLSFRKCANAFLTIVVLMGLTLIVAGALSIPLPGVSNNPFASSAAQAAASRLNTSSMGPNGLSVMMVLGLLLVQAEWIRRRRLTGWLAIGALIIAIEFVATASRNGLIALVVGELAFFLLDKRRARWTWPAASVATFLLALLLVAGTHSTLLTGYTQRSYFVNLPYAPGSISASQAINLALGERIYLWKAGLHVFANNPLTGIGHYVTGLDLPVYVDGSGGSSTITLAHSSYISMLAMGGIVGLALLLAFILPVMKRSVRLARSEVATSQRLAILATVAWLIAALVSSLFDDVMYFDSAFTALWGTVAAVVLCCARPLPNLRPWRDRQKHVPYTASSTLDLTPETRRIYRMGNL